MFCVKNRTITGTSLILQERTRGERTTGKVNKNRIRFGKVILSEETV